MTFNTGNPVGSTDARDLYDNAQNFDKLSVGTEHSYQDRLGVSRKSWAGMEADFAAFLAASGFEPEVLEYVDGSPLTVDRPTQLIERASTPGILYAIKLPSAFPASLSGVWADDEEKLVIRVDDSLRQELANNSDPAKGAGMIGFQGRFLAEYLGLAIRHVTPRMYGAVGDGVADDYAAITAAASEAATSGFELVLEGDYAISAGLDFSAVRKIRCRDRVTIKPLFDAGTAVTWSAASTQLIESPVQEGWLRVEWPTTDWTKDRTSFLIQNIYNGRFFLESTGASRALYVRGDERGCVYNDIHLGVMHQNCVGLWLGSASAAGWCNANRFFGGRFYGSNPVAGALYESQAGHIYIENAPYGPNGNEFNGPSLEWVGAGYRLARMGGLRNRLYPAYAELDAGDTTWVVDTGIENLIDCDGLPYLIGYDPDVAGSLNRVDVSTATRPVVRGNQGYHDAGGTGSMVRRVQSSARPAIRGVNAGAGPGLEARNTASGANPGLTITSPTGTPGVAIPAAGTWTVFNGTKKIHWSSSAAPTTGTWERGDVVFFTNPSAGGHIGAVCVTAGSPGTWKNFGAISA